MAGRISNLFRGFFSLFISGIERRNPEALLEVETENLRKQIASYNQGLISHAALCERLMSQVKKLQSDQADIRAKTGAHLRVGNRDAAGQYALRLQTIDRELDENKKQLEQAETTYKDLVRARDVAIANAKSKIESIKANISDLKTKRALADLTETASGMITNLGGTGDTLQRLESMVDEERSKAGGRVRVAQGSLDTSSVQVREAEQKALADQALADFAAREGIALPAAPIAQTAEQPESARKSMGPAAARE
ncbi:MAG TPA: PspA/IM30 family protein [Bryobacteraceae bacterium]|jgi:phage shock protein A|nr:PspA/IM30 family protein [Bryobacteraceae bacterium]